MKKPKREKCFECDSEAEWVRCTQFSGDHYYCDKHAREESDFGIDDGSYQYWVKRQTVRNALLTEVTLISAAYERIRAERVLAIDDPEYDLFAWGWKAAIEVATKED